VHGFEQTKKFELINKSIKMKKASLLLLTLIITVVSFGQEAAEKAKKTTLDVYYFHRTDRCATCMSIEENTKNALDTYFSDELKEGTIRFYSICYEGDTDQEAIEKYKADAPGLYLTKVKKGKETTKDVTDFAFNNSLHHGDKFKEGLRDRINNLLR
jgi:hypothetical protein